MKKLILSITMFVLLNVLILTGAVVNIKANPSIGGYISGPQAHFLAGFLLAFALSMMLTHEFVKLKHPYILSFAYVVVFSFMIELIQHFISYRAADVIDALWGIAGALIYVALAKIFVISEHAQEKKNS